MPPNNSANIKRPKEASRPIQRAPQNLPRADSGKQLKKKLSDVQDKRAPAEKITAPNAHGSTSFAVPCLGAALLLGVAVAVVYTYVMHYLNVTAPPVNL